MTPSPSLSLSPAMDSVFSLPALLEPHLGWRFWFRFPLLAGEPLLGR